MIAIYKASLLTVSSSQISRLKRERFDHTATRDINGTSIRFLLKEFTNYKQLTVSFLPWDSLEVLIRCLQWVTSVGLGGAAAADIMIAVSLVYFLSKSRTGFAASVITFHFSPLSWNLVLTVVFSRTDSLITTLMIYAINTGLLTRCDPAYH